jgi:hypothetical protein
MDLAVAVAFVAIAARFHLQPSRSFGPQGLQACVLAIGYARTWRFAQAQRWIDLARRADPNCSLLGRAQGELEAVRPSGDGAVAESG